MNEIINRFWLAGINVCLKCIYNSPNLLIELVDHLQKTKKQFKNLKKQEIQDMFYKKWIT